MVPGHIHDQLLRSHCNFLQNFLPTVFGNMVLGHHAIALALLARASIVDGLGILYLRMNDSVK